MRKKEYLICILLIIATLNIFYSDLCSQELKFEKSPKEGLRGLDLSRLRLVAISLVTEKYGITNEMLEAFLQSELKKRGAEVIDKTEPWDENYPIFSLVLRRSPSCGENCIFVRVEVKDHVRLTRNPNITFYTSVWDTNTAFNPIGKTKFILDFISITLDGFIETYNISNKKK